MTRGPLSVPRHASDNCPSLEYSLRILFVNTFCQKTKSALSADLIAVHCSSAQNFSLHFQELNVKIKFFSCHLMI